MMSKVTRNQKLSHCALGGNLHRGEASPLDTLAAAIADFASEGLYVVAISRFFETPCFPAGAGPDYVNAVVSFRCDIPAEEILKRLHQIELRFLRRRDARWGGRTLDLDLIAFEEAVFPDLETYEHWLNLPAEAQHEQAPQGLILPHPRLQDRAFVLAPLLDVAPNWRHPVLGQTVTELHASLSETDLREIKPL